MCWFGDPWPSKACKVRTSNLGRYWTWFHLEGYGRVTPISWRLFRLAMASRCFSNSLSWWFSLSHFSTNSDGVSILELWGETWSSSSFVLRSCWPCASHSSPLEAMLTSLTWESRSPLIEYESSRVAHFGPEPITSISDPCFLQELLVIHADTSLTVEEHEALKATWQSGSYSIQGCEPMLYNRWEE